MAGIQVWGAKRDLLSIRWRPAPFKHRCGLFNSEVGKCSGCHSWNQESPLRSTIAQIWSGRGPFLLLRHCAKRDQKITSGQGSSYKVQQHAILGQRGRFRHKPGQPIHSHHLPARRGSAVAEEAGKKNVQWVPRGALLQDRDWPTPTNANHAHRDRPRAWVLHGHWHNWGDLELS